MKYLTQILMLSVIPLIAFCQTNPNYERIDEKDIDSKKLEFATDLSNNILSAQKIGSFYTLSDKEATSEMRTGLNELVQKQSYVQIKSLFGEYENLSFDHLMTSGEGTKYEIYRFRGKFNLNKEVEVRVVLDESGKLAGFFVKPWNDQI